MRSLTLVALGPLLISCGELGLATLSLGPLPGNSLPADQTIEGGGQVRITPSGWQKMLTASSLANLLNGKVLCLPAGTISGTVTTEYCYTNAGGCTAGCPLTLAVQSNSFNATSGQTLSYELMASATAPVPIKETFVGPPTTCVASGAWNNILLDANIGITIDPATGALATKLTQLNPTIGSAGLTNCPGLASVATVTQDLTDAFLGALIPELTQGVNAALQPFSPSSFAGRMDISALLLNEPNPASPMEMRVESGGYASLVANGLSYGVITGFNSDEDPNTRSAALDSEPAACVSTLVAPDLATWPLPKTTRNTYKMDPIGPLNGAEDQGADVIVGVSERALGLAGHHAVASGSLCATYDATQLGSLHRDVLDDLIGVPLAPTDAPLQVAIQPKSALAMDIGDGTATSPLLTASLPVSITIATTSGGTPTPSIEIGGSVVQHLQSDIQQQAGLPAEILLVPEGVELDIATFVNNDPRYLAIPEADRRALVSTIADLVLGSFARSEHQLLNPFLGPYTLTNIAISHSDTADDRFLTIRGSLSTDQKPPPGPPGTPLPAPVPTSVTIDVGDAASVRAAVMNGGPGLPTVHITLPAGPAYAWHVEHGVSSDFTAGTELVISDRSFAWQGPHTIEVRARTGTDETTTSPPANVVAVIDYAPPTIFDDQIQVSANTITFPARDAVSPESALTRTIGPVGGPIPTSGFGSGDTVNLGALATASDVVLYVKDERGHVASTTYHLGNAPDGGTPDGGTQDSGSGGSGGSSGSGGSAGDASTPDGSTDGGSKPSASGSEDDGGCGCRTAPTPARLPVAWALSLLAALAFRARRRLIEKSNMEKSS